VRIANVAAIVWDISPIPTTRQRIKPQTQRCGLASTKQRHRGNGAAGPRPTLNLSGGKTSTIIRTKKPSRDDSRRRRDPDNASPWGIEPKDTITDHLGSIPDRPRSTTTKAPINPASSEHFTILRLRRRFNETAHEIRIRYTLTQHRNDADTGLNYSTTTPRCTIRTRRSSFAKIRSD